jgi:hypothetical protein
MNFGTEMEFWEAVERRAEVRAKRCAKVRRVRLVNVSFHFLFISIDTGKVL